MTVPKNFLKKASILGEYAFSKNCFYSESLLVMLTRHDLMDYTVHGTLQARILEWGALPFSRGSSQLKDRTQVSSMQADSLPTELS